jgi:hypothetical protein
MGIQFKPKVRSLRWRRHFCHPARQLRIEPHHPIVSDREIRWMQRLQFEEPKHRPIDLRPLRLHHVKHEGRPIVSLKVRDPQYRIIGVDNNTFFSVHFERLGRGLTL